MSTRIPRSGSRVLFFLVMIVAILSSSNTILICYATIFMGFIICFFSSLCAVVERHKGIVYERLRCYAYRCSG